MACRCSRVWRRCASTSNCPHTKPDSDANQLKLGFFEKAGRKTGLFVWIYTNGPKPFSLLTTDSTDHTDAGLHPCDPCYPWSKFLVGNSSNLTMSQRSL